MGKRIAKHIRKQIALDFIFGKATSYEVAIKHMVAQSSVCRFAKYYQDPDNKKYVLFRSREEAKEWALDNGVEVTEEELDYMCGERRRPTPASPVPSEPSSPLHYNPVMLQQQAGRIIMERRAAKQEQEADELDILSAMTRLIKDTLRIQEALLQVRSALLEKTA